jgi:hypothetical protein
MTAPRRKVVDAIVCLQAFMCILSCGHSQHTGRWVDSFGRTRPAPKTMSCRQCAAKPGAKP